MAPFQIIVLLLLVRLPRSLDLPGSSGGQPFALFGHHFSAGALLASFIASQAALVLYVVWRTRHALRSLNNPSASTVALLARTDRLFQGARWAAIALVAVHLYLLGLPALVTAWLAHARFLGRVPLLAEAFYLTPPLLAWVAFWAAAYFVERANRQRMLPYRLALGLPAHPVPSLPQFLWMQIRHNLYLVVPVGLISLAEELSGPLDNYYPHAGDMCVYASFLCLLLLIPWFITQAWSTVPLTGPLRQRLDDLARQYHLRFRNILIWKTHNAISNAAILGYLPVSRYFLMTDALLETLTDEQLESVFAHEVGHGVHHHLWWYLAGFAAALFLSANLTDLALTHLPVHLVAFLGNSDQAGTVASLLLLLLFVGLGFPFVSHRFEHQADWFAAQHMARQRAAHPDQTPVPAALLTESPPPPAAGAFALDLGADAAPALALSTTSGPRDVAPGNAPPANDTVPALDAALVLPSIENQKSKIKNPSPPAAGAEVFISSLEAIADIAHRSRNKAGWMHPSIHNRIELLRSLAESPHARKHFRRRMLATRLYLVALLLAALALTIAPYTEFIMRYMRALLHFH